MAECTIVIPCFNEARRLDLRAFLAHTLSREEAFVFVNDGSTDDTGPLLDEFCAVNSDNFRVIHLPQNRGKAEAVRQGMLNALASPTKFVGYWDADLATPLAAIGEFRSYLDQHPRVEALLGARVRLLGRHIERRAMRHYLGRLFATVAAGVLKMPVYDTQCGAKLFRATDRVRGLFAQPFRTTWIFDVELLARMLATIPAEANPAELIHEFPLSQWRDVAGSKVKARDFVRAAGQLATIWRSYRLPNRPSLAPQPTASAPPASLGDSSRRQQPGKPIAAAEKR
ncbi:MAG: glycosyltransferase [Planctomycetaceae bacterium]|nr:glycosyltransferase [Planctomycetaceae bacterium]